MIATDTRLLPLDALRGFAVMGILLLNIVGFAMPEAAYMNPAAWGGTSAPDIATWAITFVLFDGKMRGLFSLLFGASMLLIIEKAEMDGRDGRRVHFVRSAWLFAFGLAHFLLLWWGDILMVYAIVSLVAVLFIGRPPISLVKWAFGAFLIHFVIVATFIISAYAYGHAAAAPDAPTSLVRGYAAMIESFGSPGAPSIKADVALHRSGFGTIFVDALTSLPGHAVSFFYFAFDTLGFMLLGMAMLKGGFLNGQWPIEQYRRTARHCFMIGLPPSLALAIWVIASGYDPVVAFGSFFAWSFPFRVPLTVGYAALFLTWVLHSPDHFLIRRVAAAGRMALSNYLGTSLLMTAIFYGWGGGLFGQIDRFPLYTFVIGAWAIMLLCSKPWLDHFHYGPLEWVWRSLARGQSQPVRRIRN
ncbi:hypothetical protein C1T17_19425 [Sphingobium sp. SCG-1]|uniref:DUF418 domain-containing protein n=1 Tax=Sphingobium sp. SCG-1 TaxID=2072936 RepID=UPI000CD67EED|nr:DUF418 domain-containing protein [Sphingobium sp. SCG-1]AUW59925.1 hypothetical protein C1T17_19425 [Sphingobium sp. SCG-1]